MESIDNKTRRKRVLTKEEVLVILDKYRKYLNNDTIKYLESLINLDVSVFENEEFINDLYYLDDIYEIAKYNICYRVDKILKDIPDIKKGLVVSIQNDNLSVGYNFLKQCEANSFRLLDGSFTRLSEFTNEPKQPMIKILSTKNILDTRLEDVTTMITSLETKDYDAIVEELRKKQKKVFKKQDIDITDIIESDKLTLERLKKELFGIQKFIERKNYVTDVVDDILADEFKIEKDNDKTIVKRLPWIEIRKAAVRVDKNK